MPTQLKRIMAVVAVYPLFGGHWFCNNQKHRDEFSASDPRCPRATFEVQSAFSTHRVCNDCLPQRINETYELVLEKCS